MANSEGLILLPVSVCVYNGCWRKKGKSYAVPAVHVRSVMP